MTGGEGLVGLCLWQGRGPEGATDQDLRYAYGSLRLGVTPGGKEECHLWCVQALRATGPELSKKVLPNKDPDQDTLHHVMLCLSYCNMCVHVCVLVLCVVAQCPCAVLAQALASLSDLPPAFLCFQCIATKLHSRHGGRRTAERLPDLFGG